MQWIRFEPRYEGEIEKLYQDWKTHLATHDAREAEDGKQLDGPRNEEWVHRLFDKRFIDRLAKTEIPFDRPK